jgi:hypothetical protein
MIRSSWSCLILVLGSVLSGAGCNRFGEGESAADLETVALVASRLRTSAREMADLQRLIEREARGLSQLRAQWGQEGFAVEGMRAKRITLEKILGEANEALASIHARLVRTQAALAGPPATPDALLVLMELLEANRSLLSAEGIAYEVRRDQAALLHRGMESEGPIPSGRDQPRTSVRREGVADDSCEESLRRLLGPAGRAVKRPLFRQSED